MSLQVNSVNIPQLLDLLRSGSWLVPHFQRGFVWSTAMVIDLIHSILEARPIGMATLWEQAEDSLLELEPISLPDYDTEKRKTNPRYFCNAEKPPIKNSAILDGRQRCTAIAMAFGGFRAFHGAYKYAGRYFLNVAERDPVKRVVFIRETEIQKSGYDADNACIANGLFPLSVNLHPSMIHRSHRKMTRQNSGKRLDSK